MQRGNIRWRGALTLLASLLALLVASTALAAEFVDEEVYRLEAGEVIEDDLYVAAEQVYIDGTVQGDLVAAGSLVEINGTVTGDAIVAGAGIRINGEVQDDVRAAGAGIEIIGTVGDDVIAAGGGNSPMPIPGVDETVPQGIRLSNESSVGGDAVLVGGLGIIEGAVNGDLNAFAERLSIGAQVEGDAQLGANTLTFSSGANIGGDLRYSSDERTDVPEGVVAGETTFRELEEDAEAQADPVAQVLGWLWRTALILLGFVLLGWLLLRFAPNTLLRPANTISERTGATALTGLVAALLFMFIPLASALLVFAVILFWGWFPGIAMGLFLFGLLALAWFLSPLVTGLWLGRWLASVLGRDMANTPALIAGVVLIVILGRLPFIGWLVYLLSFILAVGGLLLLAFRRPAEPAAAPPAAA
jgi:cytoskeletal protein CcmA (bactofilin family)